MRCEKCLMDPCLCGTPGFGKEDDESTTEKDIKELIGRRVILKTTPEALSFLRETITDPADIYAPGSYEAAAIKVLKDQMERRLTDTTGKIERIGGAKTKEVYIAVFYVLYDNPVDVDLPGHWYLDEELIYI